MNAFLEVMSALKIDSKISQYPQPFHCPVLTLPLPSLSPNRTKYSVELKKIMKDYFKIKSTVRRNPYCIKKLLFIHLSPSVMVS